MKKKNLTINDLAGKIDSLEKTVDKLAVITKEGFDTNDKRFDAHDRRFDNHDKRFDILEEGEKEILLKLTNVAYRFELIELEKRVNVLEKKVGIIR